MASYLAGYGIEDARRGRIIKAIVFTGIGTAILAIVAYFILHDYFEKQVANRFLAELNAKNYQTAYAIWCPQPSSCPNYSYKRFLDDWTQRKITDSWKVDSTDSCKAFLTVNVIAPGAELQSLSVERTSKMLSYAPAPECQEYKWHFKAFFRRVFGMSPN